MKTIHCHPDSLRLLEEQLARESPQLIHEPTDLAWPQLYGIQIRTNPYLPRTQETGWYKLADGSRVHKDNFRVVTRFIQYDASDIPHLLYIGAITAEVAPYIVMMDTASLKKQFEMPSHRAFANLLALEIAFAPPEPVVDESIRIRHPFNFKL